MGHPLDHFLYQPRVCSMLSFWTTFVAFVVMLASFFVAGGAPLHGWTGYPPLSAVQSTGPGEGLGADLWITSIAIFCAASLMGALNFITTTLDLRAKGMMAKTTAVRDLQ